MATITRTVKGEQVILKTRISKGFDINGKRIRKQYSYKVSLNDYPTEELQNEVFNEYLVSVGENPITDDEIKELKENDDNRTTRQIIKIPLDQLEMYELNPSRPTDEFIERLAKSIYEDGLNNPIRVVRSNDKYLISAGNKRYKAYKLLQEKYGDDFSKIESYIVDYSMELNNENLDPVFALKLMRDNINTCERTIKDKILEVELYHKIFPDLKEKGIATGRENEWIAEEMGVADKSVKDYLKLIKIEDIKNKFMNDQIDYLDTALKMADFYKKYGKDDYYIMLGNIKEKNQNNNNFQFRSYMVDNEIWNKEFEERQRKNEELQKQKEQNQSFQQQEEQSEQDQSVYQQDEQHEIEKYVAPEYDDIDKLPHCYFQSDKLEIFDLNINEIYLNLTFYLKNMLDDFKYWVNLYCGYGKLTFRIVKNSDNKNDEYSSWRYVEENILFSLCLMNKEYKKFDSFKFFKNINEVLNKESIVLTIDDEQNFVSDLVKEVVKKTNEEIG